MDSLPTGSMQSWLIVASVALSPLILLLLIDAIGRVRRCKSRVRSIGWNIQSRWRQTEGASAQQTVSPANVTPRPEK